MCPAAQNELLAAVCKQHILKQDKLCEEPVRWAVLRTWLKLPGRPSHVVARSMCFLHQQALQ